MGLKTCMIIFFIFLINKKLEYLIENCFTERGKDGGWLNYVYWLIPKLQRRPIKLQLGALEQLSGAGIDIYIKLYHKLI